jgi:hypothetical protein
MTFSSAYRVYGHLAVAEKETTPPRIEILDADIAIFALGWESRCVALDKHVSLNVKRILILDFALGGSGSEVIEANRKRLREAAALWGAEVSEIALNPSVDLI